MNGSETALVSVIITTYHNERYLPRAVESVLHQSYPNIELIVVDDNPPESDARRATELVMQEYPDVIYLRHPENRNGAAARNTGIRAAKGTYIAFLDNDDFYFSDHIASCVAALEAHPDCDCVLCGVVKICGGLCWDLILPPTGDLETALLFSETALGTGSNLFVTADAVRAVNGFDESFRRHQDVEFGLRLFSRFRACGLEAVQIVKEMDGFSNAPDFDRFLATKRHLWETFQEKLNALSEQEQNRYYAGQYSTLLYAACKGGNRQQVTWTVQQLTRYRAMNARERLLVSLSRFHLFGAYEALKKQIKRRNADRLYRNATQNLSEYDLQVFRRALSGGEGAKND